MKVAIEIAGGETLALVGDFMLYRIRGRSCCAWHEVVTADRRTGAWAAQPLTTEVLRSLRTNSGAHSC